MTPSRIGLALIYLCLATSTAAKLSVTTHRPASSTWQRTTCGSPSGGHPAIPGTNYTQGVDFPGGDSAQCGSEGCVMHADAQPSDCEKRCTGPAGVKHGCIAYVFAPASCSGKAGPVCWTKASVTGSGVKAACRNSQVFGQPASKAADIPSRFASDVSSESTPLPAYPRPQMVRTSSGAAGTSLDELRDLGDPSTWSNLNGLWEWEPATSAAPPVGKTLSSSILVPFPVESCLSGVAPLTSADVVKHMWYRLTFDVASDGGNILLHFGAVDWQATVYLNGKLLGNHTGGYTGFSFDVTPNLEANGPNELLVYAYDPSDGGFQPNGKQRISAIDNPGGDTYTPSSGIWQTVWLESVPSTHITSLSIDQASTTALTVTAATSGGGGQIPHLSYRVVDKAGKVLAEATGASGQVVRLMVPGAILWSPSSPHLYDLHASTSTDNVTAYFGLRTFALGNGPKGKRPLLNGNFTFYIGFLDQSWWPDGQYTAPTDEGLAFDIQAAPMFGMNFIRLHQKVNPERWYYHADRIGVAVFQDAVQKYGHATNATVPYFVEDLKQMVAQRGNHPSILQFETFNEADCWGVFKKKPFDVAGIVAMAKHLAPHRLIDTDSGGGANDMHIGDVNDIHSYPYPGDPQPSATQYAMVGEFGGIGAFVKGKEWSPNKCHTYLHVATPMEEASAYIKMAATIQGRVDHVSAAVYTQTTDVELECDGFLNYDRSNKFTDADTQAIAKANQAIIHAAELADQ